MADEIIKTALLDRHMKEAFDWSEIGRAHV